MAVTRIKNNQITDATINAASKLVDYSITAGKLANSLTYGSDLTVTGNLTVNGATTTVSTTNTTVEDTIMILNSDASGSNSTDIGIYGERGSDASVFMGWDESADTFALVETSSVGSDTTMTITDYAPLHIGGLTADDAVAATGNVSGGNINTAGLVSATGNVTGGNLVTGGVADVTGNITGGNLITAGLVSATGNVTGGNINTAGLVSATGNITGGNLTTAGDVTTATVTASGNVAGGNLTTAGLVSATGNVTGGNLVTAGVADVTGNITGGNLITAGLVNATGNVTGGNLVTGGLVSATGNVTGGNITTAGDVTTATVNATGNITGGNLITTGLTSTGDLTVLASGTVEFNQNVLGNVADPSSAQDAATKNYVDGLLSSGFTIVDSANNSQTISQGDTLTFAGTTDEIEVAVSATDTVTIGLPQDVVIGRHLTVTGNLTVDGTTTTVNSVTSTLQDPIFQLGRGADNVPLTSDDAKDRGISMYYYEGSEKVSFMGFETTDNKFVFIPDATISGEVVSGAAGAAEFGAVDVTSLTSTGNVAGGNLTTAGLVSATGNVTGGNLVTGGVADVTGNITGGNLLTAGLVNATGNVTGGNLVTGGLASVTGNITGGNLITAGLVDATGNVSGGNLVSAADVTTVTVTASSTIDATGNITGGNLVTAGDVTTATVTASSTIDATGNITGGNLVTGGVADVTGNITGGNIITGGLVNATGNVDGANFNTAGLVSATGNVTGGNLVTGGVADVTGNITGGNLITAGILSTASILESATDVVINETGADVNFRVESDNNANMIFVDAGTDSVNIGTGTPVTGVSFQVGTSDSVLIATGNTAQRPATGVVGMLRFNTSTDSLEQYTSADGWETVGVPAFTVIASQTFNGDNSTVAFTLSESQTTASCIVSINGVVQLPTTAYGVSGTTLTFTEAPLSGDVIEVRKITTTTTVTNINSASGGASVEANNETEIDVKGNLMPAADSTYSIGNATVRWTDIYVDAGSIYLGDVTLKASSGTLQVFGSDGTTPAPTAVTSITKTGSNGTGDIGQTDNRFGTVYGLATSAQYADLAEKYEADADYEPGTVVHFGGDKEVTECDQDHCSKIAGVVSTAPAYRMNDGLEAEHTAMVALVGRVPCKVQGPVAKGDMMVSAGNGKARAEANPKVGAVIGKALEDFNGEEGVIEVVVGKH